MFSAVGSVILSSFFCCRAERGRKMVTQKLEKMKVQNNEFAEPVELGSRNYYEISRQNRSESLILLNSLSKVILKNEEKGIRDSYTLSEVSRFVMNTYMYNPQKYEHLLPAKKVNEKAMRFDRLNFCQHILETASITKITSETNSVVLSNLARCGNIWTCPSCASILQNRRADELLKLVDWVATQPNKKIMMLTLTASHKVNVPLDEFGTRLQGAYKLMMDTTKRYRKKMGEVGRVKVTEYTHSYRNRWHKHFHILVIVDDTVNATDYEKKLTEWWATACRQNKLLDVSDQKAVDDFYEKAVDVSENMTPAKIAEYATKSSKSWGLASEMAKSTAKKGRRSEHKTPFQLLYSIVCEDENNPYRLNKDMDAYIEYALYTKGKAQLVWSRGLKAEVGIDDISDADLVNAQTEKSINVVGLTVAHHHELRKKYGIARYKRAVRDEGIDGAIRFFAKSEESLPDLLTVEECEIYETKDDSAEYKALIGRLKNIAESTPATYQSRRHKDAVEEVRTDEEKNAIRQSREHVQKYHSEFFREFEFVEKQPKPIAIKSPAELRADWLRRHPPVYDQLNLIT